MAVPLNTEMWQVHFEFPYIAEFTIFIRNKRFMFHTQTNGWPGMPATSTQHRQSPVCVCGVTWPTGYTVAHSSSPVP
jgi:hypothetical protein